MAMKPVLTKFPEGMLAQIDAAADRAEMSRSEWLRAVVRDRLESNGAPADTARPRTSPATTRPVTTKAPASHPTRPPLGRQAGTLDRPTVEPRFE